MRKSTATPPVRKVTPEPPSSDPGSNPAASPSWFVFVERRARIIAFAAVLIATFRIVATYSVFSQTGDEPAHIVTGLEWLTEGRYTWEPQHPPLARVAAAFGPYLLGRRVHSHRQDHPGDTRALDRAGMEVMRDGHDYYRTLTAARLGILPFFWLACFTVWMYGRRRHGARIAALAVTIFTFIPAVLANGGIATTDMPLTACLGAALLAATMWVDRPDYRRSVLLGITGALAAVAKFSSLVFFPAAVGLAALVSLSTVADRERLAELRRRSPLLLISAAAGCVVIWAAYRFSFHGIPAPEFFQGIRDVADHNAKGHEAYFFGEWSRFGWWYFFPVMLAFKTPLAMLIVLLLWLLVPALRRQWRTVAVPLAACAAILAVGMASNINIGIRHILPIYLGLSIVAAAGVEKLVERHWRGAGTRGLVIVLALWFAGSSLLAHPDYIPYFNELALGEPEKIAIDSDLEWGQDLKRVAVRFRQLGATDVTVITNMIVDLPELGFPAGTKTSTDWRAPSSAWTAIDIATWKMRLGLGNDRPELVIWPDRLPPTEKVGAGIYLWSAVPTPLPPVQ